METADAYIFNEPVKRLSIFRLSLVIMVLCGLMFGASLTFAKWQGSEVVGSHESWFAAYVDVTSIPTYAFEKRGDALDSDVVLSFIVSDKEEACVPTWGGYYDMNEAAGSLDLDRRIARLQQQGGRIAISFGGAFNSELALHCTDHAALVTAYRAVIDRYNINTIDIDLENESLRNTEAATRRAIALAEVQKYYKDNGRTLAIWLTLPVITQGLLPEGTDAVTTMLKNGVDVAGVNLMTMNYGPSKPDDQSMFEASKKALIETHRQLGVIYKLQGINLSASTLWSKIGATPMLGQNDVVTEIFTLEDAVALNAFALEQGVGRMSMWSANRDIMCGENYVDVKVVSDVCSGVKSPVSAFSQALSLGFEGDLMQSANMITVNDPAAAEYVIDNPETSPYQIWKDTGIYLKGTKVVWRGNVYEAKWWTKNELPDNPVLQSFETPWQLIGPVLPDDKPMEQLVLPKNTFPRWSGQAVYDAGDRVLFEGVPFRAKWWNQGESPAASAANPESSPWIPLSEDQIREILKNNG